MSRLCTTVLFSLSFFVFLLCSPTTHAQTSEPTCTLTANPSAITVGGSVQLRWSSTNTTSGTISHVGSVGPSGAVNLLPSSASKTTFVGTFVGPAGTTTCSATVTVSAGSGSGSSGYDQSSYDTGGTYDPGGGTADPTLDYNNPNIAGEKVPDVTGYSTGNKVPDVTQYTINPDSFKTNPTSGTFTGNTPTVTTGNSNSNSGISKFLVPCGITGSDTSAGGNTTLSAYNKDATSCNICSFGQLMQNMVNFMLMIAIPIAAGLFAYAGILRFSSNGNTSKVNQSTKIFSSVLIGFAIALSGYLIVQTVLNAFLSQAYNSGGGWNWASLKCEGDRERSSPVGRIFDGLYTPTGGGGVVVGNTPTSPTGVQPNPNAPAITDDNIRSGVNKLNANAVGVEAYNGICAIAVRQALEAEGYNTSGHPVPAKDYGGFLAGNLGFSAVGSNNYQPKAGDIVVIQPPAVGDPSRGNGHVAMFNGSNWVSDTKQVNMLPTVQATSPWQTAQYQVYRPKQ